jgi:hypothetical protein
MGSFIAKNPSNNVERFGTRDLSYSAWHRTNPGLGMVDVDHVEMCRSCQEPLALIETAIDVGQDIFGKKAYVTINLARKAGLPVFVVLYKLDDAKTVIKIKVLDTKSKQIIINGEPKLWSEYLESLHEIHNPICRRGGN